MIQKQEQSLAFFQEKFKNRKPSALSPGRGKEGGEAELILSLQEELKDDLGFYFILFYFILFYFILFYFILFYFILFYFILFYFVSC